MVADAGPPTDRRGTGAFRVVYVEITCEVSCGVTTTYALRKRCSNLHQYEVFRSDGNRGGGTRFSPASSSDHALGVLLGCASVEGKVQDPEGVFGMLQRHPGWGFFLPFPYEQGVGDQMSHLQ